MEHPGINGSIMFLEAWETRLDWIGGGSKRAQERKWSTWGLGVSLAGGAGLEAPQGATRQSGGWPVAGELPKGATN